MISRLLRRRYVLAQLRRHGFFASQGPGNEALGRIGLLDIVEMEKFYALRKIEAGSPNFGHNVDFIPYSLPRLVACRLLAAAFYLFQQIHLFVHEASVLHLLHSVHVQRILL